MQNKVENPVSTQQSKGRMVFILMVTFFIVPIIVVLIMFKYNWKPSGESFGTLIKPAREVINPEKLLDKEEKPLSALIWKDKWSIVYISKDCPEICDAKLHDMRQLYVSLYKDMMRAQRVLITQKTDVSDIRRKYPDLIIIHQPAEKVAKLTQQFKLGDEDPETSNRLYFVDPLGFLMMSYEGHVPLMHVRKDLTKLLKYSWAG